MERLGDLRLLAPYLAKEPSPLEGVGERSFLFSKKEEEAMKEQCSRK